MLTAADPAILEAAADQDRVPADLLEANLPTIEDALGEGAIASLSRDRLRVRANPGIAISKPWDQAMPGAAAAGETAAAS